MKNLSYMKKELTKIYGKEKTNEIKNVAKKIVNWGTDVINIFGSIKNGFKGMVDFIGAHPVASAIGVATGAFTLLYEGIKKCKEEAGIRNPLREWNTPCHQS